MFTKHLLSQVPPPTDILPAFGLALSAPLPEAGTPVWWQRFYYSEKDLQTNRILSTGTPRFTALRFIVLHTYCVFYKLKGLWQPCVVI